MSTKKDISEQQMEERKRSKKKSQREYYQKNRERILDYKREYYQRNKERILRSQSKRYWEKKGTLQYFIMMDVAYKLLNLKSSRKLKSSVSESGHTSQQEKT
jgi:hypothetical protein